MLSQAYTCMFTHTLLALYTKEEALLYLSTDKSSCFCSQLKKWDRNSDTLTFTRFTLANAGK